MNNSISLDHWTSVFLVGARWSPNKTRRTKKFIACLPEPFYIAVQHTLHFTCYRTCRTNVKDGLGKPLAILSKEALSCGDDEILFDALHLPDGLYMVEPDSEYYSATDKLLLFL